MQFSPMMNSARRLSRTSCMKLRRNMAMSVVVKSITAVQAISILKTSMPMMRWLSQSLTLVTSSVLLLQNIAVRTEAVSALKAAIHATATLSSIYIQQPCTTQCSSLHSVVSAIGSRYMRFPKVTRIQRVVLYRICSISMPMMQLMHSCVLQHLPTRISSRVITSCSVQRTVSSRRQALSSTHVLVPTVSLPSAYVRMTA